MPAEKSKRESRLETFKTFSTFLSSVVIALATFFATWVYNSKQLEISQNKALSELIPKLGDSVANVRKFNAISLALHGKNAVPALMAIIRDDKQEVRNAAATALGIIGTAAALELINAHNDKRKDQEERAAALYALGLMRHQDAFKMAEEALKNEGEDRGVRIDAAEVLGMFRDKRAVETLLAVLKQGHKNDTLLIKKSLEALSKIKDVSETNEITKWLSHPNENIRVWALWALLEIGDTTVIDDIRRVDSVDTSENVRGYARRAMESLKPSNEFSP